MKSNPFEGYKHKFPNGDQYYEYWKKGLMEGKGNITLPMVINMKVIFKMKDMKEKEY